METDKDIISRLRCQLKEAEEERRKAAEYGLKLVESENLLQNRLDELQNEIVTITENFEQEKYTLQRDVELKNRMLGSLSLECESLKQQQSIQLDVLRGQLQRLHGQEINELKNKVEKLKLELDETLLSEKQLKHKVDHLKDVIASKSEELRVMSERVHETMSSEVLNLQLELLALEQAKAGLEDKLHDLQYNKEQLELGNSNLTNRVAHLEEEKEEREKDLVSYCNALEKEREMNRELQIQLDHALQQALDPSSKGNSLFAEVEDRRAEMERQLISIKVKYQMLQKQNTFTREQLQRMKLQMATLLRMKGSQGEHDQLERLQSMLQQKNGEIEELLMKVKQLEKSTKVSENSRELKLFNGSDYTEVEDGYYTDLLQMKLENSNKEIENLKSELSLQRMKALFESQRVLEMERKLFAIERQFESSQSENINLHVLLDELKIKYEPEELMKHPINLEKAPADIISDNLNGRSSSLSETSSLWPENKENIKQHDDALKTTLQAMSMNIIHPPAMEHKSNQQGKKKVRIKEELDVTAICKKDGNDIGPSYATRLTSEPGVKAEENCDASTEDASKHEKQGKKKTYPVIYMSSKQNSENQCIQQ
ncbi:protein Spindly [Varanus komodoensis]|uniref:protein Spindly n=1 Tax=Varanus komodoensis TaxID=61221 RepID=UPI001CF7DEDE|nr:protein Spindly [Varanus komodoensis]XP_044309862.1 protein Spindly [Varanus komodoensis]XP_044309863.1 protein Spindly [Varanus komodoensis]XP_044309864.1 protein Spindly [Varanus komodoensis]